MVFTREKATGSLVLYVDGAVAATGTRQQHCIADRQLRSSTSARSSSGTTLNYTGVLDEVAIYNTDLTRDHRHQHYNAR